MPEFFFRYALIDYFGNGRKIFKVRKRKIAFTCHPKNNFTQKSPKKCHSKEVKTFLAYCHKSLLSNVTKFKSRFFQL